MPQLSLYLDDDTMDILRQDATREGVSLSKHASRVIRENNVSAWPKGFFDLYGALDLSLIHICFAPSATSPLPGAPCRPAPWRVLG